jgi:DNA-directed RNA polymerase sigma subunit (sigma70/sigma32)
VNESEVDSTQGTCRRTLAGTSEAVAPVLGTGVAARFAAASRLRERRLVREAQRGSAEALEHLFRRHWAGAYRAAWVVMRDAAAAEDIAQEAFLSAVRALDRFDRRRPFAPGCTGSS